MTELSKEDLNRLDAFDTFNELIDAVIQSFNRYINAKGYAYAARLSLDKALYDSEFMAHAEQFVPAYAEEWMKKRLEKASGPAKKRA